MNIDYYNSSLGRILLAADDTGLTGLWFEGQKYFAHDLAKEYEQKETTILRTAKHWLDIYFSGGEPDFNVPLHFIGTAFQRSVWQLLCEIPYGQTSTYGELAKKVAEQCGLEHMSAQAVGAAVGRNKISIIVPCHRVLSVDGKLTGYAGGLEKKAALLKLENAQIYAEFR